MQQLTSNLFVETGIRGCNHGFVTTSDGIVMIDSPHKPSDALKLKAEIARRGGRLRYIINTEPHGDHWTGNAFFDVPVIAHEGVRTRILETDLAEHVARVATFGPEEPKLLEGYRPNAPVITFTNGMTLHVGNHTFELIHMPGHTAYQAAICIKEEGAVFTSDNIFHKCHTWLQEANPDEWLTALESLRGLKEEVFVPVLNSKGTALAATGAALPVCFGHWIQALGFNPGMWVPKKVGAGYENNTQLKLFDPIRDKINIFSGMKYFLDGRPHETHTSTVQIATTGSVFDSGPIGPSLDSKIADVIGTRTRFRSLEVSYDGSRQSWSRRSGTSINPSEGSPVALYKRVFGPEFKDPNAAEFTPDPLVLARKGVLSAVTDQRAALIKQVGASDKARLDEFFTSIREIENQLELQLQKPSPMLACSVPKSQDEAKPDSLVDDMEVNSRIMANLVAYAMACGQTRVFNTWLGAQGWRRRGSAYTWHSSTHEESIDPALGYQKVVYDFIHEANEMFVEFVKILDAVKEGDGTLLDRTLVLWQTDHGDARTHSLEEIPIMTAGNAGGRMKSGLHVSAPGEACTRVGLTVQQIMGVPLNTWGTRSNETTKTFNEIMV